MLRCRFPLTVYSEKLRFSVTCFSKTFWLPPAAWFQLIRTLSGICYSGTSLSARGLIREEPVGWLSVYAGFDLPAL